MSKKAVIALLIVIPLLLAICVGIFFLVFSVGKGIKKEIDRVGTVTQTFDDGSDIYYITAGTYRHGFPGGGQLYFVGGNKCLIGLSYVTHEIRKTPYYVSSYAWDGDHCFAVHWLQITSSDNENTLYIMKNGDLSYYVIKDTLSLFDTEENDEYDFETLPELLEYCKEHDIRLGDWYYYAPNGSVQAKEIDLVNTRDLIVTYPNGMQALRRDGADLFYGRIKSFCKPDFDVVAVQIDTRSPTYTHEYPGSVNLDLPDGFNGYVLLMSDELVTFKTRRQLTDYCVDRGWELNWRKP